MENLHTISDKSCVIASRCPECGAIIADRISIFSMSSGHHNIKCKICGKSTLTLALSADGKIRLSVPCLVCPHPHPFTLASTSFFNKELFILQCSYSGLDICFIGTENDRRNLHFQNIPYSNYKNINSDKTFNL